MRIIQNFFVTLHSKIGNGRHSASDQSYFFVRARALDNLKRAKIDFAPRILG